MESLLVEERASESPYIETVTRGRTLSHDTVLRPAERHWHMVLSNHDGQMRLFVVGPLTAPGTVSWGPDAGILWIKFSLGAFMPHLPLKGFVDSETPLPGAAGKSFWLKGAAWEFPTFDNVETFVDRLVREEVLVRDPLVGEVLAGHPQALAERTLRQRFVRATGLAQRQIWQMERAERAAALLRQGVPILDTVEEAGYFDQPHLTRALRQWIGPTPAQLLQQAGAR